VGRGIGGERAGIDEKGASRRGEAGNQVSGIHSRSRYAGGRHRGRPLWKFSDADWRGGRRRSGKADIKWGKICAARTFRRGRSRL